MIALPPQIRVFLYRLPTDMRKSFNGLVALTESALKQDPLVGKSVRLCQPPTRSHQDSVLGPDRVLHLVSTTSEGNLSVARRGRRSKNRRPSKSHVLSCR